MPRIKTNGDGAVWDPNDDFDEYIEEQTRVCRNNENEDVSKRCVVGPDPQPLSAFRKGGYGSRNWTCIKCFVRAKTGRGIEGDPANVKEEIVKRKTSIHGNSEAFKQMIKNANEGRDVIKTKPPSVG